MTGPAGNMWVLFSFDLNVSYGFALENIEGLDHCFHLTKLFKPNWATGAPLLGDLNLYIICFLYFQQCSWTFFLKKKPFVFPSENLTLKDLFN